MHLSCKLHLSAHARHTCIYWGSSRDFLFDVHFVDLQNFQPLARFKVQKFAEVTKIVLGFKCDSSAPQTAAGECFYRLNK